MESTSCCACLVAEDKLYSVEENNLQQALEDLTDLPVGISSLPLYLCYLCRALVLKYAAFRAAYRHTHLILRAIQNGQTINGEIMQQEDNVRKKAGFLLTISKTNHIDIYNEEENCQTCTAEEYIEVNDDNDYSKETKPGCVGKTIYIDSDLIRNQIESAANYNLLNDIDFDDDKVGIVQNDHDYIVSDCGDDTENKAGNKISIEEEFHTSDDADSTIGELDPVDELANFYSNKRNKQAHALTGNNDKHIENRKTRICECMFKKNDKQNNKTNRNNYVGKTAEDRENDLENIVFKEPDKYTSKLRKKTREVYEEFAKKYNMKVNFLITKEEQMNTFLARKETVKSYKKATLKCELCYIGFMTNRAYSNHMKKHEKRKYRPFECDFCHRYFPTNYTRVSHLDTHRVQYICVQCGDILARPSSLEQHFKLHSNFKYDCKFCSKTFRLKSAYYNHVRVHGSTNGASKSLANCLFCDNAFNGPAGLKMHMRLIHSEAQDCFCGGCGRQFSNEAAQTAHEGSCSADNSPCVRCGASFPNDERLAEHVAEAHTTMYTCNECKMRFRRKDRLCSHIRYSCRANPGTANKGRKRNVNREEIRRGCKREDQRMYQVNLCEVCGKTLKNIYTLRDHMRIHTGEKPYKCTECGKTFRMLPTLQVHMTTHTDERRYKCSLCSKAFRQPAHLRAHMFSHTKERLYACKTCPKRYSGQGSLKEHVDTAHRGLPPRRRAKKQEQQEL